MGAIETCLSSLELKVMGGMGMGMGMLPFEAGAPLLSIGCPDLGGQI